MNWGKGIVVSFILFAVFIGVLVAVCVRQDISLVATDYYRQELDYQKQIDREKITQALTVKPDISIDNNSLVVSFKDFNRLQTGELKLFRPSNAGSDFVVELKPTADSVLTFDVQNRERGMYKAQLKWSMSDQDYYLEKIIYL